MVKTHQILVRGLSKSHKNSLKRLAQAKRLSVNSYILTVIDEVTTPEIDEFMKRMSKKLLPAQ